MKEWLSLKMAGGDARPEPRKPVAGTLAALALVVLIGFLDYATGSEVILEIIYLVPIVLSTSYFNRTAGLLVATAAAGAWVCSDILLAADHAVSLPLLLNTATHAGVFVIVVFILSGLKQALLAEQRQRNRLEELDRLKNQLLGMAAHDLRSPSAIISMYAEMLREKLGPAVDERQRKFLDIISEKSAFMLRLIGDVLDVSRIESGAVDLKARVGDYGGFVAEQVRLLGELGAARGVTVRLEDAGLLPPLPFDRDRMEQVLSNMVGNALKFSPAGAAVTVRVARENGRVLTQVSDQGPGLPPEECQRIFEPFQRGSAQPVRGEKGTGLGLAISRKIVEAHGGRIGVESTVGRGSTFWYSLPVADR